MVSEDVLVWGDSSHLGYEDMELLEVLDHLVTCCVALCVWYRGTCEGVHTSLEGCRSGMEGHVCYAYVCGVVC